MADQGTQTKAENREFGRELVIFVLWAVPLVLLAIFVNEQLGVGAFWIQLVLILAAVVQLLVRRTRRRARGEKLQHR